jgi:hypothetical protein
METKKVVQFDIPSDWNNKAIHYASTDTTNKDQLRRLDIQEAALLKKIQHIQEMRTCLLRTQQEEIFKTLSIGKLTVNGEYTYQIFYRDIDNVTNTVLYNVIQDKPITNWRPAIQCNPKDDKSKYQVTGGPLLACTLKIDGKPNETTYIGDRPYYMKHKTHLYTIHDGSDNRKDKFFYKGIQVGTGRYCVLFTHDPAKDTLVPNKVIISMS